MLLVDDIVLFPMKSVLWIFDEIYHAAEEALESEADDITVQLQQLYRMLESGGITEAEFDVREAELLDRLEAIQE
jgi:hypothetical protein